MSHSVRYVFGSPLAHVGDGLGNQIIYVHDRRCDALALGEQFRLVSV
jgi:hypothetical protein